MELGLRLGNRFGRPNNQGSRALGTVRKKAIVAVARRLAVDLWRLHTGRCTAEQLGFTI